MPMGNNKTQDVGMLSPEALLGIGTGNKASRDTKGRAKRQSNIDSAIEESKQGNSSKSKSLTLKYGKND